MTGRWLLPEGVDRVVLPLLVGKALRAFADGYVAVLLPAYLLALGFGTLDVGILSTATLLGSAFATLAVGAWGHRFHHRNLLLGAALLMLGTGLSSTNRLISQGQAIRSILGLSRVIHFIGASPLDWRVAGSGCRQELPDHPEKDGQPVLAGVPGSTPLVLWASSSASKAYCQ